MNQPICSWPLYDRVKAAFAAAQEKPPERSVFGLLEIADETSAIRLIDMVAEIAGGEIGADGRGRSVAVLGCIESVINALNTYRNFRDWTTRPSPDWLKKLGACPDKYLKRTLEEFIHDPERRHEIMARLLEGARAASVVEEHKDQQGWKARIVQSTDKWPWLRGETEWAMALAEQPALFKKALREIQPKATAGKSTANLVRRLRSLMKTPTSKKFRRLLADEQEADVDGLEILTSALRYAARHTVYRGRRLQKNWIDQVVDNPELIGVIASKAHELLKKGLHGKGRAPTSPDHDRFAEQVAAAYRTLTGKNIGYARATGNVVSAKAGMSYGRGLEFMLLALRMIDGATQHNQARWHIDRIRKRASGATR